MPRGRKVVPSSKTSALIKAMRASPTQEFTAEDFADLFASKVSACARLHELRKKGVVRKTRRGHYVASSGKRHGE